LGFNKILVAVDDSEFAARAADVAIELAKGLNCAIGFMHVFDPSVGPGTSWGVPADRLDEMNEHAARYLIARFREKADGKLSVSEFVSSGKPASKIIESAKHWAADLIVMGSHGRGKIQGLLLGSVSQEVLHHAPCPVLVVRA
jgi:nucleotide-binding universal stress UspA family protein